MNSFTMVCSMNTYWINIRSNTTQPNSHLGLGGRGGGCGPPGLGGRGGALGGSKIGRCGEVGVKGLEG